MSDLFRRIGPARGAAVGALLVGSLVGATTAAAASNDVPVLDHQLTQHLGPSQRAAFSFHFGGDGDVAQIVLLPTTGSASQLAIQVFGPDRAPVALDDGGQTSVALKENVVSGPAGTYTVEVSNQDGQAGIDFAIAEQDTALTPSDGASSDSAGAAAEGGVGD